MTTYQFNDYNVEIARDYENKVYAKTYIDLEEMTDEGAKFLKITTMKQRNAVSTLAQVVYLKKQGNFNCESFVMFQDFRTTYGTQEMKRATEAKIKEYFEKTSLDQDYLTEIVATAKAFKAN